VLIVVLGHDLNSSIVLAVVSMSSTTSDTILILDLSAKATVGPDRWGKARAQPVKISVFLETSLIEAGKSDDVEHSIDYGGLSKEITRIIDGACFDDLYKLAESVANLSLSKDRAVAARVVAEALNQFLMAESLGVSISRKREGMDVVAGPDQTFIKNLRLNTIIGLNPPERVSKQVVISNVTFHTPTWSKPSWQGIHNKFTKVRPKLKDRYHPLTGTRIQTIEDSSFLTLEAFASKVAQEACDIDGAAMVTVRAQKPSALVFAQSSGVEITRTRAFFSPAGGESV